VAVQETRQSEIYVQYGCGTHAPEGWLNFDCSPRLVFEKIPMIGRLSRKEGRLFPPHVRYGNILKGLPLPDDSCRGIYASHILEHLPLDGFRVAIRKTYALLKQNGIFRILVPDTNLIAKRYVTSTAPDACEQFVLDLNLGRKKKDRSLLDFFKEWLGNSYHGWMWDSKSLKNELEKVGFINIRDCSFNDSCDLKFKEVERKEIYEDSAAVECEKP